MRVNWLQAIVFAVISSSAFAVESGDYSLSIVNTQPFAVSGPIRVKQFPAGAEKSWSAGDNPAQIDGSDLVVLANVEAKSSRTLALTPMAGKGPSPVISVRPTSVGLTLLTPSRSLGDLEWDVIAVPAKKGKDIDDNSASLFPAVRPSSVFSALPLHFTKTTTGPLFDRWSAEATTGGLKLSVHTDVYAAGFIDFSTELRNEDRQDTTGVYCASICKWTQPEVLRQSVCYDNRTQGFSGSDMTSFRAGTGRHLALQRGVDWVETQFVGSPTVSWLNDFDESFTVRDGRSKLGPRWFTANQPQLGQELETTLDALYLVTEISRSNIRSYRDRYLEYSLPMKGDAASFASRLSIQPRTTGNETDNKFIGYTCYYSQERDGKAFKYTVGVPSVRFGTAYFPYSTLGENFDRYQLPCMSSDSFWPLAADTVLHWRDFADDIRRDLRIIKAMGFQIVRLHHLELLSQVPPEVAREYLDFLFGELQHLGLRALLDVQVTPEQAAGLVSRYRPLISGVEVENEILIWAFKESRVKYWNQIYDAVKRVAPDIPVHLTASANSGIFSRLFELGGKSDRIGLHNYIDSLDAIPSGRGMATAVGNYAAKVGREPVITEWNWRQLTRMPREELARLYPEIIGGALQTRSIPEFYEFQFNDTLSVNPRIGRGNIERHYEIVNLSRRPKAEVRELMKLIAEYSESTHPFHTLSVSHPSVTLESDRASVARFALTNLTDKELMLKISPESPGYTTMTLQGEGIVRIPPKGSSQVLADVRATTATPGYTPIFLRIEGDQGLLHYGWGEALLPGSPQVDLDWETTATYVPGRKEALSFNLAGVDGVVYGGSAPMLEHETAIMLQQTLESATGHLVGIYNEGTLPQDLSETGTLILLGSPASNPLVAMSIGSGTPLASPGTRIFQVSPTEKGGSRLVIAGSDPLSVEEAGVDVLLRYWKTARDSGVRRAGLSQKKLSRGQDASKLP